MWKNNRKCFWVIFGGFLIFWRIFRLSSSVLARVMASVCCWPRCGDKSRRLQKPPLWPSLQRCRNLVRRWSKYSILDACKYGYANKAWTCKGFMNMRQRYEYAWIYGRSMDMAKYVGMNMHQRYGHEYGPKTSICIKGIGMNMRQRHEYGIV